MKMLYQRVPRHLLLELHRRGTMTLTSMSRIRIHPSYSHVIKTVSKFEGSGICKSVLIGRTRYVSLTEKGTRLADMFEELESEINAKV